MNRGARYILTYHSVDGSGSVVSISPEIFREQMALLAASARPVVPLSQVRDMPGAVALTFDDGFRNFFEYALPILRQHRFPATVFVISEYCGRRNDWPSQPRSPAIPVLDLMSWSELRQVAQAGITVGCHTATHPPLDRLSEAEIEEELCRSQARIEDRIGAAVRTFCYPYGDCTPAVRKAVARYYEWACGTELAFISADSDPWNLPRIDTYYLQHRLLFQNLGTPPGEAYVATRRWLRRLRHELRKIP